MKFLQIGAATFSPSAFPFVSRPSTFPAQTAVVICGVNPIVQRSRGRIKVALIVLLLVPVFAPEIRHPASASAPRQKSEAGREFTSERIFAVI